MKKSLQDIENEPLEVTTDLILELISFIDLTSLGNTDTTTVIDNLIEKANKGISNTYPAAVCTFANFSNYISTQLQPAIKIVAVGGTFPTGQNISEAKIEEVRLISQTKAQEIDIVLNKGHLIEHEYDKIAQEISQIKNAIGTKHLKVILETGELNEEQIKKAAVLSIQNGADFIKTSTGKSQIGATPQAVLIMSKVIHEHFQKTGHKIGIKPSGGIRTLDEAISYYKIIKTILGKTWLTPNLFRIGASTLYDNLVNALNKKNEHE